MLTHFTFSASNIGIFRAGKVWDEITYEKGMPLDLPSLIGAELVVAS